MTRAGFFRDINFYNRFRLKPVLYKAESDLTPEELAKLDRLLEARSVLASRKLLLAHPDLPNTRFMPASILFLLNQVNRELYRLVEVEHDHAADKFLAYDKAHAMEIVP